MGDVIRVSRPIEGETHGSSGDEKKNHREKTRGKSLSTRTYQKQKETHKKTLTMSESSKVCTHEPYIKTLNLINCATVYELFHIIQIFL